MYNLLCLKITLLTLKFLRNLVPPVKFNAKRKTQEARAQTPSNPKRISRLVVTAKSYDKNTIPFRSYRCFLNST